MWGNLVLQMVGMVEVESEEGHLWKQHCFGLLGLNMDEIEWSSVILHLWVFPIPGSVCPLEQLFHRLSALLVGDLAGASLVKWIVGRRGRVEGMQQ